MPALGSGSFPEFSLTYGQRTIPRHNDKLSFLASIRAVFSVSGNGAVKLMKLIEFAELKNSSDSADIIVEGVTRLGVQGEAGYVARLETLVPDGAPQLTHLAMGTGAA